MTWGQVFTILNQLIDAFNTLNAGVDGVIVNGQIDYNVITNKPTINNVELTGDLTQADLGISLDSETQEAINALDTRVGDVESSLSDKVSDSDLATKLEDYALVSQLPDTSELATKAQLISALSDMVPVKQYTLDLASLQTALSAKASAASTPTTAQWNQLVSQMTEQVTRAENATSVCALQTDFDEVVARVKQTINRLNTTVHTELQNAGAGACGGGDVLPTKICITDIPNTFSFDD